MCDKLDDLMRCEGHAVSRGDQAEVSVESSPLLGVEWHLRYRIDMARIMRLALIADFLLVYA